jgi:hypothetical protein
MKVMAEKKVDNIIVSIGFNSKSKKHKKADAQVIGLINEYLALPSNAGIPAKSVMRNHLLRTLREAIDKERSKKAKAS